MTSADSTVDFEADEDEAARRCGPPATTPMIGTTLQIVGETLCESIDVRAGERVLDVAAGNGNASLAAARRGARSPRPTT